MTCEYRSSVKKPWHRQNCAVGYRGDGVVNSVRMCAPPVSCPDWKKGFFETAKTGKDGYLRHYGGWRPRGAKRVAEFHWAPITLKGVRFGEGSIWTKPLT